MFFCFVTRHACNGHTDRITIPDDKESGKAMTGVLWVYYDYRLSM